MDAPADESPVPAASRILRLPTPPKIFVPERWRPTYDELRPSSQDEEESATTGRPVRVSVWDETLTTREQALTFRGREALVIRASVASVLSAGAPRVVYDRHAALDIELPGAAGHAGIEGLERANGEEKKKWKARLQFIADVFVLI